MELTSELESIICMPLLWFLWKLFGKNPVLLHYQGGKIMYFGEPFTISMDMVNDFWKIVFHFYGMKKL